MTFSLDRTGDPFAPWYDHRFVVYDVETTGLDADNDRVIEMGFARFESGELVDQWGTLLYPGREIPEEATKIHGISTADVASAPSFSQTLGRVVQITRNAWPVAYNASFDRKFWLGELNRVGIELPTPIFDDRYRWLDPLIWIRHQDGIWGKNKLTDACARYGVDLTNAHRATDDAIAAGRLLFKMVDRLPAMTIFEMLKVQHEICAIQDREREEWFRRKNLPYNSNR